MTSGVQIVLHMKMVMGGGIGTAHLYVSTLSTVQSKQYLLVALLDGCTTLSLK